MATRSLIAIVNPDSTVFSIYCHFSGEPQSVGYMLMQYYNDSERIQKLLNLGHIVQLRPYLERSEGVDEKEVTVAYHRDRGEGFSKEEYPDTETFVEELRLQDVEYAYLYISGRWVFFTICNQWHELLGACMLTVSPPALLVEELAYC